MQDFEDSSCNEIKQNFMNIKPLVYLVWSRRSETIFWYQSAMLFQQFCLRIWACCT